MGTNPTRKKKEDKGSDMTERGFAGALCLFFSLFFLAGTHSTSYSGVHRGHSFALSHSTMSTLPSLTALL